MKQPRLTNDETPNHKSGDAMKAPSIYTDLAEAAAHLREEADLNRSWVDGRRGDREAYSEAYINQRLEAGAQRDRWADAIQKIINERLEQS
jgi:hypothetical protein